MYQNNGGPNVGCPSIHESHPERVASVYYPTETQLCTQPAVGVTRAD